MRAMTRWTMAGALTLAAVGAIGGLATGAATADAAPSVSPFAGSYHGHVPGSSAPVYDDGYSGGYDVEVTASGKFTATGAGTFYFAYSDDFTRWTGEASGSIRGDGRLSVGATETFTDFTYPDVYVFGPYTYHFRGKATMTRNADGSLSGVAEDGTTFVWTVR
jgi:hypothetical protein